MINDSRPGAAYVNGWSGPSENVFVDPVRKMLMLCPAPRLAAWQTGNTNPCQRFTSADLVKTGSWIETDLGRFAGDVAMHSLSVGGTLKTPALLKNQGIYLAIYNYQATTTPNQTPGAASAGQYCEGIFANSAGQPATSFRWYYDRGQIEVFRGASLSQTYNLIGEDQPQQGALRYVDLLVIPCGPREILFLTNAGRGAYHAFTEAEVDDNLEVTGAGAFEFEQPAGQVTVQLAPMKFASSGFMCGYPSIFPSAPPIGATFNLSAISASTSLGGTGSVDLREEGNSGPFVPNGVDRRCQVRVSLTAGGANTGTLFVSALQVYRSPETDIMPGDGVDVLEFTSSLDFSVGDDPGSDSVGLEMYDPDAIESAGAPNIVTGLNRSCQVLLGPDPVFDIRLDPPRFSDSIGSPTQKLLFEGRTIWKHLSNYRFQDDLVLDGKTLTEAARFILQECGVSDDQIVVSDDPFTLPSGGNPSLGDYSLAVKPGDTPAEWLTRLRDDFASTWALFVKGDQVIFRSPEDFPAEPIATIYNHQDESPDPESATVWRELSRKTEQQILEPEANDIWVWGFDPRTQRSICVHYADTASQDPTLAVIDRPDNWLGEIRRYALFDPGITTKAAAIRACGFLAKRLCPARYIRDIECEFIEAAWKNDLVAIPGEGNWRIQQFSGSIEKATEGRGLVMVPTNYILEKDGVQSGAKLGAVGRSADTIAQMRRAGYLGVAVVRPRGNGLDRIPRQSIIELASPDDTVGVEF